MNVLLACLAALSWGVADFLGGYATRDGDEIHSESVLLSSQLVALLLASTLLFLPSLREMSAPDLLVGAVSGLGLALGVRFLYAALATGRMAVVAPVSAATCVVVSVFGGILNGGSPAGAQIAGLVLVSVAVLLASRAEDEGGDLRKPLLLALLAGTGFGSQLLALSFVESGGVGAQIAGEVVALMVFASVAYRRGVRGIVTERRGITATCGTLRAVGTCLFVAAISVRSAAATTVAANLYPVFTGLTAAVVLRERVTKVQLGAVLLAVAGIGALLW